MELGCLGEMVEQMEHEAVVDVYLDCLPAVWVVKINKILSHQSKKSMISQDINPIQKSKPEGKRAYPCG